MPIIKKKLKPREISDHQKYIDMERRYFEDRKKHPNKPTIEPIPNYTPPKGGLRSEIEPASNRRPSSGVMNSDIAQTVMKLWDLVPKGEPLTDKEDEQVPSRAEARRMLRKAQEKK